MKLTTKALSESACAAGCLSDQRAHKETQTRKLRHKVNFSSGLASSTQVQRTSRARVPEQLADSLQHMRIQLARYKAKQQAEPHLRECLCSWLPLQRIMKDKRDS